LGDNASPSERSPDSSPNKESKSNKERVLSLKESGVGMSNFARLVLWGVGDGSLRFGDCLNGEFAVRQVKGVVFREPLIISFKSASPPGMQESSPRSTSSPKCRSGGASCMSVVGRGLCETVCFAATGASGASDLTIIFTGRLVILGFSTLTIGVGA